MARSGWDLQRPILGLDGRQIAPDFLRYLQGAAATASSLPAPAGPQGVQGPSGPGVATGGAAGEVLAKAGGADFETGWIALAAIARSGSASDLDAGTVPAARMPALSGDVTSAAGGVATALKTVNGSVGAFGDASHSTTFTVNAKGLVTAAGSQAIAIGASAVTGLAAVATSGSAADLGTGVLPDARLSSVITAGSGGDASHTTALTWDAHGRLTTATPVAIAIASTAVSGLGTAATRNTGLSGAAVPLLNAANTWATTQTFTVAPVFTNAATTRTALGLGTLATQSGAFSGTSSGTNTGDQTFSLSVPAIFTAGGSSTSALSFGMASQAANLVWAGPASGVATAPGFRALAAADIPSLDATQITSGALAAAQAPALTGDVASVAGTGATTLATVNASPGTFGDSGHVAQVTVNAKGLATAATSVAISPSAIGAEEVANKDASGGYPSFSSGPWTPVLAFATPGTSSFSYSARFGQYVQIGNLVYLDFFITFTPTIGTASGNFQISNLPFTVGGDLDSVGSVRGLGASWSWGAGVTLIQLYTSSTTTLSLSALGSGIASATLKATSLTSGSSHSLGGTIIYRKL